MQFNLPHKFSKFEAKQRVQTALSQARGEIPEGVTIEEERWEGDTLHFAFTAQGQHITGSLVVAEKDYEIEAKLPLMLRLFEGRIKKAIEEQTAQIMK